MDSVLFTRVVPSRIVSLGYRGESLSYPMCYPCQLCPQVVDVVELVCFNDLWGTYMVESLIPSDRSKLRFQTKKDTGVYAVRG